MAILLIAAFATACKKEAPKKEEKPEPPKPEVSKTSKVKEGTVTFSIGDKERTLAIGQEFAKRKEDLVKSNPTLKVTGDKSPYSFKAEGVELNVFAGADGKIDRIAVISNAQLEGSPIKTGSSKAEVEKDGFKAAGADGYTKGKIFVRVDGDKVSRIGTNK